MPEFESIEITWDEMVATGVVEKISKSATRAKAQLRFHDEICVYPLDVAKSLLVEAGVLNDKSLDVIVNWGRLCRILVTRRDDVLHYAHIFTNIRCLGKPSHANGIKVRQFFAKLAESVIPAGKSQTIIFVDFCDDCLTLAD